jgi:hypothetical protein
MKPAFCQFAGFERLGKPRSQHGAIAALSRIAPHGLILHQAEYASIISA